MQALHYKPFSFSWAFALGNNLVKVKVNISGLRMGRRHIQKIKNNYMPPLGSKWGENVWLGLWTVPPGGRGNPDLGAIFGYGPSNFRIWFDWGWSNGLWVNSLDLGSPKEKKRIHLLWKR
jgi:hypothetical protein